MRPLLSVLIALSIASVTDARADAPTTMIIRNLGGRATRVQVALGPALPCDSSDNRMRFDGVIPAGVTRVLSLDVAVIACARNTSGGSTVDWGPSNWLRGGYRCGRGRGAPCWPDSTVPMRFDVRP